MPRPNMQRPKSATRKIHDLEKGRRSIGYRVYDRDTQLDEVCAIILNSPDSVRTIAYKSGTSYHTMQNWLNGKTRRPQRMTMEAVLNTQGKTFLIVDIGGNVVSLHPKRKKK